MTKGNILLLLIITFLVNKVYCQIDTNELVSTEYPNYFLMKTPIKLILNDSIINHYCPK